MMKYALIVSGVFAAPAALYFALSDASTVTKGPSFVVPQLSAKAFRGKNTFAAACGTCHGTYGEGTDFGPALVHGVYAPHSVSDEQMRQAIMRGAVARRWPFGDMPAVPGLNDTDISSVIGFVREMQAANDIY